MKKREVIVALALFAIILISGFAAAENHTTNTSGNTGGTGNTDNNNAESEDAIDKGYQCLEDEIGDKTALSLQEAIFSALALGNEKKAVDAIIADKKTSEECWPKSGCKLKETAQVLLAYDRINKNTEQIEKWLLGKNGTASELSWYLEIDIQNHNPTECTIRYDGTDRKINVNQDMKLSGNAGSCLTLSSSGYWLKISPSCLEKTFEVTCNEDFITTLLYEKATGGTIYVSMTTHSAASLGRTEEKVNAQCFKGGTSCDYEGSLWATLALHKTGHDVTSFVPYLVSTAEDNQRFLPSAFLYIAGAGEEQYSELIQSQKEGKYWQQTGTQYNRFYDTSLAMLALYGSGALELDNAKNYLLSIQGKNGCWNSDNIRDTAFVLYSGWPKAGSGGGGGTGGGDGTTGGGTNLCESVSAGYSCGTTEACADSGGSSLYEYECIGFAQFCCNVKIQEKLCSELNGKICATGQQCNGKTASSADGSCCIGTCEVATQDLCVTLGGGECRTVCYADEEEGSYKCTEGAQICCVTKTEPTGEEGISMWIWILILGILILLVLIGIVYRTKLRIWWHGWKGGITRQPVTRGGPGAGYPTPAFMRPTMQRFGSPVFSRPQQGQPSPRARVKTGDEFEDTMRKLREMGK